MAMLGFGDYLCEACKHFDSDGEDGNHPSCDRQWPSAESHLAIRLGEKCPFGYEFGIPTSYEVNQPHNKKRAYEIKAILESLEEE